MQPTFGISLKYLPVNTVVQYQYTSLSSIDQWRRESVGGAECSANQGSGCVLKFYFLTVNLIEKKIWKIHNFGNVMLIKNILKAFVKLHFQTVD